MLILFNTKTKRKLLAYAFSHTNEEYYVRELALLIHDDPGNLSRELKKLEAEGMFVSRKKGNLKFFSLNNKYPLYNELKQIVSKTEGIEGSLRELVKNDEGIELAFIHGSFAKGKENKESDIDLVVAGNINLHRLTGEIRKLEKRINREINFTSYTLKEFAAEKNKVGGFLNIVLKDTIIPLKGIIND